MSKNIFSSRRNTREHLLMYFYSREFSPNRNVCVDDIDDFIELIEDTETVDRNDEVREAVKEVFDNIRITKLLPEDIVEFLVPYRRDIITSDFESMDRENVKDGFISYSEALLKNIHLKKIKNDNNSANSVPGKDNSDFFKEYVKIYFTDLPNIDNDIEKNLENWDFSRISIVDKIILRMGIVELKHFNDTPHKVIINEAIELGKKYSADKSNIFINGILNRMKDVFRITEITNNGGQE